MLLLESRKILFSLISICLGIIGAFLTLLFHYKLGIEFSEADGKTQAFYGLKSFFTSYKFSGFGLLGFLITLIAYRKKENLRLIIIAVLISLLSIILPFFDLWKLWT